MNSQDTSKLAGVVQMLLDSNSRVNQQKSEKYWYPLSMATYGVEEIIEALDSMCSFRTSMWEKTLLFEQQFAKWHGSRNAIMVNSGSSADLLLSFGLTNPRKPLLKVGDEVLVPVVTWATHVWSPMMAGLKVVFVDVDPLTLNIDFNDLESKITENTKAVFPVHLMGNPVNLDKVLELIVKHDLYLLEDCCEALGSTYNGYHVGNASLGCTYSFFFSHHITTMEGGMIVTDDDGFADELRIMRAHGWTRNIGSFNQYALPDLDPRYMFVNWGFNLRPTEVQAAFGLHQLNKLPYFNQQRKTFSTMFRGYITDVCSEYLSVPVVEKYCDPSWLALPVMVKSDAPFTRSMLTTHLEDNGVETRPIVAGNLQKQPVATVFPATFNTGRFKGADQIHENGFYVGLSPMMTEAMMTRLIETFDTFLSRYV